MWIGDTSKRLTDAERAKLLEQRAELVEKVKKLKSAPLGRGDQSVQAKFRAVDLTDLATKILNIDKKLNQNR